MSLCSRTAAKYSNAWSRLCLKFWDHSVLLPGTRSMSRLRPPEQSFDSESLSLRKTTPPPSSHSLTIYHNPQNRVSRGILESITEVRDSPLKVGRDTLRPPKFEMIVHERVPTMEELSEIVLVSDPLDVKKFIHPNAVRTLSSSETPTNVRSLHALITRRPELVRWPITINWETAHVAVGRGTLSPLLGKLKRMHQQDCQEV
ncbi:hypothetical protein A0H81_11199 [Grifola frondosa]|uniref:Uncharacterized protein n=1 Tax=Grifola frondosa TaxID=5627 RepID=A0A1C7LVL4_GRIFR|nr:hypothetical protein A0H81_11199 [Grifola frondosa]